MTTPHRPAPAQVRAWQVLRNPKAWYFPAGIVALLALLLSLLYLGGVADPSGDLHRLPIGLVNADRGTTVAGRQENLGAQLVAGISNAPDPKEQVSWRLLDGRVPRTA